MVVIDTSALIEFFNKNGNQSIKKTVRYCLLKEAVGLGDLIYCEILQGFKFKNELIRAKILLSGLNKLNMVNFELAEKSAFNYRLLRSRGVTVRKTIDVLIATYCIENKVPLLHNDIDFTFIEKHTPLKTYSLIE
jgi:predicted nucleic acid-binding protein